MNTVVDVSQNNGAVNFDGEQSDHRRLGDVILQPLQLLSHASWREDTAHAALLAGPDQLHNTYSSWDDVHHQANKHSIVQNLNILCIVDEQEEDREAGKLEANLLSFVPSACSAAATEQLHGQLDGSRSCSDPSMSLSSLIWICSRPCTRSPKDQVTITK